MCCFETIRTTNSTTNITTYTVEVSEFCSDSPSKEILEGIGFIFGYALPLGQLIILAILIRRELKRPKAVRSGLAEQDLEQVERMERRMAKIGFIIVLVFIICQTPQGLNSFLFLIDSDKNVYQQMTHIDLQQFLGGGFIVLNSCVNFIIYFMHGANVKEKMVNFCCWKKDRKTETRGPLPGM